MRFVPSLIVAAVFQIAFRHLRANLLPILVPAIPGVSLTIALVFRA